MGSWVVFTLFLLTWGRSANAKVVVDFSECDGFFYKRTAPDGIPDVDKVKVKLCQQWKPLENSSNPSTCFATLYDTFYRIPVWSAYTLIQDSKGRHQTTPDKWFIEPQLFRDDLREEMQAEREISADLGLSMKEKQAVNDDYEGSYFDQGHLFPNTFQETTLSDSTFTLTNAVPMDPFFNRVTWSKLEKELKSQLLSNCVNVQGLPYLVTGSVPNQNRKIPVFNPEGTATPSGTNQDYNRVSVPSHVWTAVCCDHPDENKKFSLAFLGENKAEGDIETLEVQELAARLQTLYASPNNIAIFSDVCEGTDKKLRDKISSDIRKNIVSSNIKIDQVLERKRAADNLAQRSSSAQNQVKTSTCSTYSLQFTNYSEWAIVYNSEPGYVCVLSTVGRVGYQNTTLVHDKLYKRRKRSTASETEGPVCLVQKKDTLPRPALGGQCLNDVCSNKNEYYSWCWTAPWRWDYCCTKECEFNEKAKLFECQSSSYGKVPCSPQYSSVTAAGGACRRDHPCGRYGYSYYWCYTDYEENWNYCCAPRYPCGSTRQHHCAAGEAGGRWVWCHIDRVPFYSENCRGAS